MTKSACSTTSLPWIAAIAFFMQTLDATILNTALPSLAKSLGHHSLSMQAVVISYTLASVAVTPISGWLADRFGVRRVFMFAVLLFILGSVACALSQSFSTLIASRTLQGIGGAMMVPISRLALLKSYPKNKLLTVMSLVTIPGLIGPILGPLLGGILVTYATWHWIFLVNVPIGICSLFLARRCIPDFIRSGDHFDFLGFCILSTILLSISIGVELLNESNASSFVASAILIAGSVLIFFYVYHARRHSHPLIRLDIFNIRTFSIGIVGNIVSRLGTGCIPFLIPLMVQVGLGHSAINAGFVMTPIALGSILGQSLAPKFLRLLGYRHTLVFATLIISAILFTLSPAIADTNTGLIVVLLCTLGISISTQFIAISTITLVDLSSRNAASGNSILAVTQQMAISIGISISSVSLEYYYKYTSDTVQQFELTFTTMAVVTVISAFVFLLFKAEDGQNLIDQYKS